MSRPTVGPEAAIEILRTPPNAITLTVLRGWIAATKKGPPKYDPEASVPIPEELRSRPPGDAREIGDWDVRFAPNWTSVRETTVGRLIANNLFFSRSKALREAFPYIDKPMDSKVINDLHQRLMDARLDGKIDHEDMAWVIDRMQWLGYAPTSFLAPSMTIDTIRLPPTAKRLKREILASERGKRVREGDLKELGVVEKEIITAAKQELDGKDPGFDIFASGARGSVGNNFKQTAVMRGAIRKSDDPSVTTVSTASLEDGTPLNELPAYADLIVQASYGRSIMTQQGGYIAKQLNAAFQSLALDPSPTSDCRTPLTLPVTIDSPREYLYRFFKDGGKFTEIVPDNLDTMKGRSVQMRSPLFCGSKTGICSRCAGTLHHRMGVTNIGLVAGRIGTTLLNASLKAFHDTSLKLTRIKLSSYVKEL